MTKQRVMVAILAGDLGNHAALTALAFRLPYLSADQNHPFAYALHIEAGTNPQELARNQICKTFLGHPADILLMIDNDMIADPESLSFLATPDYDIAAPMMFMWWPLDVEAQRQPQCYTVAGMFDPTAPNKIQPMTPVPNVSVATVDWVGSGCIAIKRRVLEDARMQFAPGCDPPAFWRQVRQPNGVRTSGLDIDFCRRARALDYTVKVNWSAEVGHFKHVDLNQVEMYKQLWFLRGHEVGEKSNGLRMAEKQCGPQQGRDGVARPARGGNGTMGIVGLDPSPQSYEDILDKHARARAEHGPRRDGAPVRADGATPQVR